jgi:hypothetical protein
VVESPYISPNQCSLLAVGAEDIDDLYDRMKTIEIMGLSEDVGRYV